MKVSEAFPSNYLKAADLGGRTVKVTINAIRSEDIGGDHKLVMYFQGKDKGLVLNKTNASTLAMAFGDDTDGWGGAHVEMFPQSVPFNGQMVPAIRMRVPEREPPPRNDIAPNARARSQGAPPLGQEMDDEIPF